MDLSVDQSRPAFLMIKIALYLPVLIAALAAIYFAAAFLLILSQRPIDLSSIDSISFEAVTGAPPDCPLRRL